MSENASSVIRTVPEALPPTPRRPRSGEVFVRAPEAVKPVPPASCGEHGRFWPVLENGSVKCPSCLLPAIRSGAAALEDPEAALDVIRELRDRAGMVTAQTPPSPVDEIIAAQPGAEPLPAPLPAGETWATYEAVVAEDLRRRRREVRDRLVALAEEGDPTVRRLVGKADLAAAFRVSEKTIERWAGSRLPAPLRRGKRVFWDLDAILSGIGEGR